MATSVDLSTACELFIQDYFSVLHQQPEELYRFYEDRVSVLSRPGGPLGETIMASSLKSINETLCSFDSRNCLAHKCTIDRQRFNDNGLVMVLVTGQLVRRDNSRRRFAQMFVLVPTQDRRYFIILNDMFRYLDASSISQLVEDARLLDEKVVDSRPEVVDPVEEKVALRNENVVSPKSTPPRVHVEPSKDSHAPSTVMVEASKNTQVSVVKPSPHHVEVESSKIQHVQVKSPKHSQVQVEVISYASIVSKNSPPVSVPSTPTSSVKSVTIDIPQQPKPVVLSSTTPKISAAPASNKADRKEVKSNMIQIWELPSCTKDYHMENYFKKFGTIKQKGVTVRSYKNEWNEMRCHCFVDFESASSVEAAIKASPVTINRSPFYVERRRPPTSRKRNNNNNNANENGSKSSNVSLNDARAKVDLSSMPKVAIAANGVGKDNHVDEDGFKEVVNFKNKKFVSKGVEKS